MTDIACQEEHRPEHWKHGQSPRAVRIVVFQDGHREALCARHLAEARRTGGAPRDVVEQTEPVTDQEWWAMPSREDQCTGYVGDAGASAYRCELPKGHVGRHRLRPATPSSKKVAP